MSPATYDRRRLDRTGTGWRRTWTAEQRARIIAESYGSGEIVKVYKNHGFQRYQRGDKRPAFDALCQDAAKRQFEMLMAWSVDRLGRRLQDLVGFLSEPQALRIAGHHPTHCEGAAWPTRTSLDLF
jgi:DNA invertase Pin-like site-specific DNA recombinase